MSSAESSSVSVVVCTYDIARLDMLTACLESIHKQSCPPDRVVVVVDGSAALAAALEQRAGPELIVPLERNVGLSAARNAGVEHVDTEWVAFLDDDAVADTYWLERLLDACEQTAAVGSGGWSAPMFERGEPTWFPPELLWTVGCSYRGLPEQRTTVRNVFGGCAMFRTDILRSHGGFDTSLGRMGAGAEGGEEAEFCLRVVRGDPAARFAHEPTAIIHHHVPADRARVRYLLGRCYADGKAKARVARARGIGALSSESSFVLAVPASVARHLRNGRPGAAVVLIAGVAAAASGYLLARLSRPPRLTPAARSVDSTTNAD